MDLGKLVTLGFDRNVGTKDRIFRVLSGVGVAVVGWALTPPGWAAAAMTVFGLMRVATGALSKCTIYYALGYSSCPTRDAGRYRGDP